MSGSKVASRSLRVALLTQYFPPEIYPQPMWLAEALINQGLHVQISTSIPNYPSGVVPPGYNAATPTTEWRSGIRVTRAPVFPSHDHRALGRILNYSSFACSSAWTGRKVLGTADVTLVWATPATVGFPALVSRYLSGTPYVLYIQDLWPDSVFATGFLSRQFVRRTTELALSPYLRSLYASAEHVVAITPGMETALLERGVPPKKMSVIYNWVDEEALRPVAATNILRSAIGVDDNAFVIVFAGNVGVGQDLGSWVDAMDRLRHLDRVHLVILGHGSDRDRLRSLVSGRGQTHVHFLDPVPVSDVSATVADANALVLSLADEPLFHITLPSKTQAALAQGKPILCSAPGEARNVVERAGAGWTAEPGDPESIAQCIRRAEAADGEELARRGSSGRDYYVREMSRGVGAPRLARLLKEAARS